MKSTFIGIACFLVGLSVGIWLSSNQKITGATAQSEAVENLEIDDASNERSSEATILVDSSDDKAMSEEPALESIALRSPRQVTVSTSLIELLSQREGNRTMGQALLDPEGAVEQALGISDKEMTMIQTSWESTKEQIHELEAHSSTVEELEDYSVKIALPDLSQQLNGLANQFSLSVQETLGQNRAEVLLAAKQINQLMKKSAQERIYTIAAESLKEGEWRFNMTLESKEGRRVWVGNSIPEEIRHLADAAQILPRISDLPE